MAVIKDVAKLAGVSVGTVSKYLNNPQNLKEETRQRVESAINTLRYTPSPLARSMRTGKSNTIAVIAPDISNPFFAEVYDSIRVAAAAAGYTAILYTTEDNLETLKSYLMSISIRQIDGLILCFVDEDEYIENFIEEIQAHIPIVLLSWDINNTRFSCISVDVSEGIYKSTNHLISQGYKDIAYIGGHEKNSISVQKYRGYVKAVCEAGYALNPAFRHTGDFTLKTGYYAARALYMLPEMPDAIVAENDILAIGAIKYFLQRNIRVPDNIAVIGFDNITLSAMYEPALSTISLPINQMGEESVKLLMSKLTKPGLKNKLVILKNELIIRSSTDKNAPIEFI